MYFRLDAVLRPPAFPNYLVLLRSVVLALGWLFAFPLIAVGQPPTTPYADQTDADAPSVPQSVEVQPVAEDQEIEQRLSDILGATSWFNSPAVAVDQGVVFLEGSTLKPEHRTWAGDLARNTQDVVAVVNRIQVVDRPIWDLSPAWGELRALGREAVQMLPLLAVALVVLCLTWLATRWAIVIARGVLGRRLPNPLLVNVFARAIAIPVFLLGLYLTLRVSGLTQMAATVLGGTGLIGLVIGIAFRDIAENFLASLLLSVQRPFALGDFIEVEGCMGIVQSVTSRGTLLMTPEGNHVQIPNSSIYKSIIRNKTANPNVRCDFSMRIDYTDSLAEAQDTVLLVLITHEAVLQNPTPMVLVEELGEVAIIIRAYFWVNDHERSAMKVKSSVMRLARVAIHDAGLRTAHASFNVLFPQGMPLRRLDTQTSSAIAPGAAAEASASSLGSPQESSPSTAAEVHFKSDRSELEEQARLARNPEQGTNLLAE